MKKTVAILILIIFASLQGGEFVKVGTTAAQFLKVEPGARALAMGGCYGAIADDASALYWNPAGIAQISAPEATFTHTAWIARIYNGFIGVVLPLSAQGIAGFSVQYQMMDEIEQTTIDQPTGTGLYFSQKDFACGLTYARAMTDFINVGITGKLIYQSLWNETAMALALDMGVMLDTGIRGLKIGMVMTNFGTDMQLDGRDLIRGYDQVPESILNPHTEAKLSTEEWPLPTNLRLSVKTDIIGGQDALVRSSTTRLSTIVDLNHPNDYYEQYNGGIEMAFSEKLFFRMGYRGSSDEEGLTAGGGVKVDLANNVKLLVDYAYADFGVFKSVQHFTFGIKF